MMVCVSEPISSASNPLVKRLRALSDRRARTREQAFVVEGVAPVWQAVEAAARIEVLVCCTELLADSPAVAMVEQQAALGVRVTELTRELFERVSGRDGPSGLAAIISSSTLAAHDLRVATDGFLVAAHEMSNPGNLGTVIRTAEALGADGLLLVGGGADPFSPQAVKASMGSLFHLPIARLPDLGSFFDWAEDTGVRTVTSSARTGIEVAGADLSGPVVLLLGAERTGLPTEAIDRSDLAVAIPMAGRATSFNVAVAAGILMYEASRQLRR
jgi:TrmH family RNA methyltransferase